MDELERRPVGGVSSRDRTSAVVRPDEHGVPDRLLAEVAIEAASLGTFTWDLPSDRISWDARMLELFGYAPGEFDGRLHSFDARVDPRDLPGVHEELSRVIAEGGRFTLTYRVAVPGTDGRRWVTARGRAIGGPDGVSQALVGAAFDDTTERAKSDHVASILESIPTAFFSLDREWRMTYVNTEAERVLLTPREAMLGRVVWDAIPAAVGSDFEVQYRRAVETGEVTAFEAHYPEPLDRWYEVHAAPRPDGLAVYFLNVTAHKKLQQETAEAARRASLLAAVTSELTQTLDTEEAVARLAQLLVPSLADWCVVTLATETDRDGRPRLRDIGTWHAQPEAREAVARYAELRLTSLRPGAYLLRALEVSGAIKIPTDATVKIAAVLEPGEARELLESLAPESACVLPMRARGRTIGALTLFNGPARAPLTDAEAQAAEDVAGRAGLALDNARLYEQQRRLAEGLQRSLLTQPPQSEELEIVVRYRPAAEAARVGGDWYDAFCQGDGSTTVVIGDVAGHDIEAAASMGELRALVRGVAMTTGSGPSQLLRSVDDAHLRLGGEAIATAVIARIEPMSDDGSVPGAYLRWSNAGHPYPIVVDPDGGVTLLDAHRPDILLGVRREALRREDELPLAAGSIVLLYTDGLVERRDRGVREGMAELTAVLGDLVAQRLSLDEIVDEALRLMLPEHRGDDVAILAVRLT